MADEKVKAEKAKKAEIPVDEPIDVEAFINRKLKAINKMANKAKAKSLANRVMNNKRGK